MAIICSLPALIYAGVYDWKKRIIPNKTIIALLGIGLMQLFFSSKLNIHILMSERILGMFIPGMILFFIYLYNPKLSGGGDLKLLASLGFCIGIYNLAAVMSIACVGGIAHSIICKQKYIPLGTYIMLGAIVSSIIELS